MKNLHDRGERFTQYIKNHTDKWVDVFIDKNFWDMVPPHGSLVRFTRHEHYGAFTFCVRGHKPGEDLGHAVTHTCSPHLDMKIMKPHIDSY